MLDFMGISSLINAGASMFGANQAGKAADKQVQAAREANALSKYFFNEGQGALSPFYEAGGRYSDMLEQLMPFLTSPIKMDQATLEQTPGYQFNLSQGLRAGQNALTAAGLGRSGATAKTASRFATGLADSTYRNQFDMENINRSNAFTRLMQPIQLGQQAASSLAGNATQAGGMMGQNTIGAGNAQAGGIMSGANMLMQGANGIGSNLLLQAMMNRGNAGGSGMYGPETAANSANPFFAPAPYG
jgi:hypothetical protein